MQLDRNAKSARFVALVQPYLADAYTLARWLTRSRDDADEVLQEACIRALRAIEQQSGANARAWLLSITRNTAYTWLRNKSRTPYVALDDLSEKDLAIVEEQGTHGVSSRDPEAEMIARADAEQLKKSLTELPIEFREALVLRDIHGLGYQEIAEVTGVPVGTVMSRLARARRRVIETIRRANS